jgi:SRSO17 transposase
MDEHKIVLPSGAPVGADDVEEWAAGLDELHGRISSRFYRLEMRERAGRYIAGLLGRVERKNCWQLAEHAKEATPDGMQRLLSTAFWDADRVRDDLRDYVLDHLGEGDAVLVIDETGFLKKGDKSVGVKRQYSGTAGRIENCQIGVFLGYVSSRGRAFLDRELYLPQEWARDPQRREEAGVPGDVEFATKPELALGMLRRAWEAGARASWVTGDEVYGGDYRIRSWLAGVRQPYVLAVRSNTSVSIAAKGIPWPVTAGQVAIREEGWQRLSAGDGAKGPRLYDWALVPLAWVAEEGYAHHLLVRRKVDDPEEMAYYLVFAPVGTDLSEMVRAAGMRWGIEEAIETAKGEAGLDEYEVRSWQGWYRHVTLSLLAHAFLVATRARAAVPEKGGARAA